MSTAPRYTLDQLLEAGREQGFDPSKRLLKDWIELGLLDQARKRGKGRGKGIEATWSENQKQLLLVLLDKRRQVKRIASLCNIPVALWLWWGDDYVPIRQVSRAMSTWAGKFERVSWQRARWTAEQLVGRFAHPDASAVDRTRLTDEIARSAYGQPFRRDVTLELFRPVFDPHKDARAIGPPWLGFNPENFVLLTDVRLQAIAALRTDQLDETAFHWCRHEYLQSRAEYAQLLPSLGSDREAAELFLATTDNPAQPPTFEEIVNQACVDLLTLLGIYVDRLNPSPRPTPSHKPPRRSQRPGARHTERTLPHAPPT